jgi:FtsP/CotA-like multicopper oxidase with cupredoxin domain
MRQRGRNCRGHLMTAVAPGERLPLDEQSLWTFSGDTRGLAMPHPIHIHGLQFPIVERTQRAPADLRDGPIDAGFHDTMLVFPGEQVRLTVALPEPRLFMDHGHNPEHEDRGMMRNCWSGPGPVKVAMPPEAGT